MELTKVSKLGFMLRHLRKERGWSQAKLAEEANVERTTILRLENGEYKTGSLETLQRLAQALEQNVITLKEWGDTLAFPQESALRPLRLDDAESPSSPVNLALQIHELAKLIVDEERIDRRESLLIELIHLTDAQYHSSLVVVDMARGKMLEMSNKLAARIEHDDRQCAADVLVKLSEELHGYVQKIKQAT